MPTQESSQAIPVATPPRRKSAMPEQVIEIWTPAKLFAVLVAFLAGSARRATERPVAAESARREK